MSEVSALEHALAKVAQDLGATGKSFALVGGLAVSVRAEVRFTRDVDFAVAVVDDAEAEALVYELRAREYQPVASVEHEVLKRLATIRLLSKDGVKVDLLFASSGIEPETAERASIVAVPLAGDIPIARAEELLAMKVLSMTERRLQDRIDAQQLLAFNPGLDLATVHDNLRLIRDRGFDRGQDLEQKLASLLASSH